MSDLYRCPYCGSYQRKELDEYGRWFCPSCLSMFADENDSEELAAFLRKLHRAEVNVRSGEYREAEDALGELRKKMPGDLDVDAQRRLYRLLAEAESNGFSNRGGGVSADTWKSLLTLQKGGHKAFTNAIARERLRITENAEKDYRVAKIGVFVMVFLFMVNLVIFFAAVSFWKLLTLSALIGIVVFCVRIMGPIFMETRDIRERIREENRSAGLTRD